MPCQNFVIDQSSPYYSILSGNRSLNFKNFKSKMAKESSQKGKLGLEMKIDSAILIFFCFFIPPNCYWPMALDCHRHQIQPWPTCIMTPVFSLFPQLNPSVLRDIWSQFGPAWPSGVVDRVNSLRRDGMVTNAIMHSVNIS